jgi:hypothetical protein
MFTALGVVFLAKERLRRRKPTGKFVGKQQLKQKQPKNSAIIR